MKKIQTEKEFINNWCYLQGWIAAQPNGEFVKDLVIELDKVMEFEKVKGKK